MIKAQIIPACEGFKKLNMPKIEDKEFRNQLIDIHFALLDEKEKYEKAAKKTREVIITEPIQKQADEFEELRSKYLAETDAGKKAELERRLNTEFSDVNKATAELGKKLNELGLEEVKIGTVSKKKFREEYAKQDYSAAVVENLHPLLADDPEPAPKKPAKK